MAESFAVYLAKNYIAHKGFKAGAVPEAAVLKAASDFVVTRGHGLDFEMICIIDATANPKKHFTLTADELQSVGRQCERYTGRRGRKKMHVCIYLFEVSSLPADAARRKNVKHSRRLYLSVMTNTAYIDTTNKTVLMGGAFNGLFLGRPFIEGLLASPPKSDVTLQNMADARSRVGEKTVPWLTSLILIVMALAFAAEQHFKLVPNVGFFAPGMGTLLSLGASNYNLVVHYHEYYRLFSAVFLHAGPLHIVLNLICMYMAGVIVEQLVGRWWLAAIFVVSALAGSLMSLAINPPNIIMVGASGAIMGLLAAAYIFSFRLSFGAERTNTQRHLLHILIPSLVPIAVSLHGERVDVAAHFGGMVGGLIIGWIVTQFWPKTSPRPEGLGLAISISLIGLGCFGYALDMVSKLFR